MIIHDNYFWQKRYDLELLYGIYFDKYCALYEFKAQDLKFISLMSKVNTFTPLSQYLQQWGPIIL